MMHTIEVSNATANDCHESQDSSSHTMIELPDIMVSPTGARRTKSDHPQLPTSLTEIVDACVESEVAGATGVHLHIREDDGTHSLDAERYQKTIDAIRARLPDFFIQITSESAGRYSAAEQRALIDKILPTSVSVALREFVPDEASIDIAGECYHRAHEQGVHIQHICYSAEELARLLRFINDGVIPGMHHHVQLVLGSYDASRISRPEDVAVFADPLIHPENDLSFDWMMCAFGTAETDCLKRTVELGGKARIGFENSLWHRDGRMAASNAERVAELIAVIST